MSKGNAIPAYAFVNGYGGFTGYFTQNYNGFGYPLESPSQSIDMYDTQVIQNGIALHKARRRELSRLSTTDRENVNDPRIPKDMQKTLKEKIKKGDIAHKNGNFELEGNTHRTIQESLGNYGLHGGKDSREAYAWNSTWNHNANTINRMAENGLPFEKSFYYDGNKYYLTKEGYKMATERNYSFSSCGVRNVVSDVSLGKASFIPHSYTNGSGNLIHGVAPQQSRDVSRVQSGGRLSKKDFVTTSLISNATNKYSQEIVHFPADYQFPKGTQTLISQMPNESKTLMLPKEKIVEQSYKNGRPPNHPSIRETNQFDQFSHKELIIIGGQECYPPNGKREYIINDKTITLIIDGNWSRTFYL